MKAVVYKGPFEVAVENVADPVWSSRDPAQPIMDGTDGFGVDCGVEAVGYQAHDQGGQEHPEMVLDTLIEVVRATGRIGVVGVYDPEDPDRLPRASSRGPSSTIWEELSVG